MRVLKVVLEGITTSFRYPHFMMGVHPSFPMPPPATIYGHICSALGEWVDPAGLRFAYHFTYDGMVEDLEHIHVLTAASGRLPGSSHPKALEGNVNPFRRQLLFHPRLVLYVNRPEWEPAFRSPRYAVVLGRSQDLCTYTSVEVVELPTSDEAYLEHTLLPYRMAAQTLVGIAILMPRWVDYEHGRRPAFARYLLLQRRVLSSELIRVEGTVAQYVVDPDMPQVHSVPLGLVFHSFVGDEDEALTVAP
jgi:CRISPR-associated protein Cas5t